jgi:enolase-phosphatase E1
VIGVGAVVTDIEGTTTPISFVRDRLFPYARARMAFYVAKHRAEPPVAAALDEARALAGGGTDDELVHELVAWIDEDRKVGPLKLLQGMIWEEGYRIGALKAPVYGDAVAALKAWREAGIALYVYSSGSVTAQKLLFGHSDHGDLEGLFSGWFDLTTGSKLEAASYRAIAARIGGAAGDVLFLSDHPGELDAAAAAGLRVVRVDRGAESMAVPASAHPTVESFAEIESVLATYAEVRPT